MNERVVPITLTEAQARAYIGPTCQAHLGRPVDEEGRAAHDEVAAQVLRGLDALPPPMEEPTYPGAVVYAGCATDDLEHIHVTDGDKESTSRWYCVVDSGVRGWPSLTNPRPLTDAERRDLGMPGLLLDRQVAVRSPYSASTLRTVAKLSRLNGNFVQSDACDAIADALEAGSQRI